MITNWLSQVGNIKRDGKKTHTGRMMLEKNKSTTPSLAFPFALNLNKTGSFSEKEDIHFGGSRIK